ncbi:MAG: hypothetical protein KBC58_08930 [Flavobacterium sp.]|jgi:hypothetical protein|uniref:hypothetical protein n=1 Tax=Flavobacterium sp. TaxID=239 RepID=UPI001B690A72|nr:hypothetical protein [Flavobacterium sp.]
MLKIKIILLATAGLFLFSCNTKSKEEKTTQIKTEEHQHSDNEAIHLNDGEKWKVDDNMMEHIRNMENDIVAFTNKSDKNYTQLASKLKANLDLLTSNCTMKGQAHDELHKWLVPYIDLVDSLEKENTDEQFKAIQHSFETFNQYFK